MKKYLVYGESDFYDLPSQNFITIGIADSAEDAKEKYQDIYPMHTLLLVEMIVIDNE